MMQQLPHEWDGREDTRLNLQYFKKYHKDGRSAANPSEWNSEGIYYSLLLEFLCVNLLDYFNSVGVDTLSNRKLGIGRTID